jgi:hypothetical protein
LLRIPFFLDRAIRGGNLALASRAGAVEDFLIRHGRLDANRFAPLAEAAFEVYVDRGQRSFPPETIRDAVGREALQALRNAGILVGESELAFDHQFEHDFLAARHLAADSGRWSPKVFDGVTFRAATFDVLALTLEQLEEEGDRDAFLRAVYDWNWRGTVTAMATAEQDGSAAASAPLRTALLAVIAEKKFDAVDGTRDRTIKQLARFSGPLVEAMSAADSIYQLVELVASEPAGPQWFEDWRRVFCRGTATELTEEEIARVATADPVIGWTMANVARRFETHPDRALQLRTIYAARQAPEPSDRAVRWRVVHALGAWPGEENADALVEALDDEYGWVKYGAMRSLVEMAARTDDAAVRDRILDQLTTRVGDLPADPLSQIAWTSLYHGASTSYADAVRPLVRAAADAQVNETDRNRWARRVKRFEQFWAGQASG